MKRVLKAFAVAAAGLAVAFLAPAAAWAACPGSVFINQCLAGGGIINPDPLGTADYGGTWWLAGLGLDAIGPGDGTPGFGTDAGQLAGYPITSTFDLWLPDFNGDNTVRCMFWDWVSFGSDGCADGVAPMFAAIRNSSNQFVLMSVGGAFQTYDFDFVNNGITGPFGGTGNGIVPGRAVHAISSSDLGATVQVNVAALNLTPGQTVFDDMGGARALPGTARLRGRQGGLDQTVSPGGGGGMVTVDADSNLCWELVDVGYTVTLGCIPVGGDTPSQNVVNAKGRIEQGKAVFSWDVTAQFDVLSFNIIQTDVTKGRERVVTSVGISGQNDATDESYRVAVGRSDIKAARSGFELELVRLNGEKSRTPITLER